MRAFVVGTGRSGTSTFYQAARHIVGYTAGHESTAGNIPSWEYPDNHIEVSSQLVYGIPRLRARYPDAVWVHLIRDRNTCIQSLARQCWDAMQCFSKQWFQTDHPADVYRAAAQFYDLTNELITATAPPDTLVINLEDLAVAWPEFCRRLQAEYDPTLTAFALERHYNPGVRRGRDNYIGGDNGCTPA